MLANNPPPARIGQFTAASPITGGVDAVSALLMRDSVINEWFAKENGDSAVFKDVFTQWIMTFPTKHFYVDLMNDPVANDDFAPTMQDPDEGPDPYDGATDPNNAFAPFSEEFDAGPNVGQSCETFAMDIYDREEAYREFVSPSSQYPSKMCNEVNVVVFNQRYENKGLASKFALTVPQEEMPIHAATNAVATSGWAKLSFTGVGTEEGLSAPLSCANGISYGSK